MIKIYEYGKVKEEDLVYRKINDNRVDDIVSGIIEEVIQNGDEALIAYAEKFDKADLISLVVSEEEIKEAYEKVDKQFIDVMEEAKKNIYAYHINEMQKDFEIKEKDGVILGRKIVPIEKVGVYIPGGTAAYPSSVLMNVIPAKIAGVKEIIMTTPTNSEGKINANILVASQIAGVTKIIKSGGAQAIAALAYGTESVPYVDKIVGPGNTYVAEAKRQVYGKVAIDMIAGPSEILVISDDKSDYRYIASDLLSQAEHDRLSMSVLITNSYEFATKVKDEISKQIKSLPRYEIANDSISTQGKIIVTKTIDEAIELSNKIAPEHLELCVDDPFVYLDKVTNAGSVFLGRYTPEPIGDYFAGPNHTIPTMGRSRFSSALSVEDFTKKVQYVCYEKSALEKEYKKAITFAKQEGLLAHAKALEIRFEE